MTSYHFSRLEKDSTKESISQSPHTVSSSSLATYTLNLEVIFLGTVYAQAGLGGISYEPENGHLLWGSPGAWDWSGTVVVTKEDGFDPKLIKQWSSADPPRL